MSAKTNKAIFDAINVSSENVSPCIVNYTITIPGTKVSAIFKAVTKEIVAEANIPGYRRGHAPIALVTNRYKQAIESEVAENFQRLTFAKVSSNKELDFISLRPLGECPKLVPETDASWSLEIQVAPPVDLPAYKGCAVDVEVQDVTEEQITARIARLREVFAEFTTITEGVTEGDLIKANYTSDLVIPEDASVGAKQQLAAENSWIWLNNPERIPGIIAALSGKQATDTVTFTATYAEDYVESVIAGKTVNYTFTIIEAQRRMPIADTEALCKRMRVADFDTLQSQIRKELEQESEMEKTEKAEEKIVGILAEKVPAFDLPPSALNAEINRQLRILFSANVKTDEDAKAFNANREQNEALASENAKSQLHRFFILRKIAKLENIEISQLEFDEHVVQLSRYLGIDVSKLKQTIKERELENEIAADILTRKVAQFLAKNATINVK